MGEENAGGVAGESNAKRTAAAHECVGKESGGGVAARHCDGNVGRLASLI